MKVMTDGVRKEKERLTAASMKVLVYSWQRLSFTGVLIFLDMPCFPEIAFKLLFLSYAFPIIRVKKRVKAFMRQWLYWRGGWWLRVNRFYWSSHSRISSFIQSFSNPPLKVCVLAYGFTVIIFHSLIFFCIIAMGSKICSEEWFITLQLMGFYLWKLDYILEIISFSILFLFFRLHNNY